VNAYSAALTLDRAVPALYSNRAACFFCLGDDARCAEDAGVALKMLDSKVSKTPSWSRRWANFSLF
jgi:hypothetical protein